MSFEDQAERYGAHLAVRHYAARTIVNHVSALRLLFRFFAEARVPDPAAVTTATLLAFQTWEYHEPTQRGTARAVRYQNRVLAAVRGFFHFLREDGVIPHDPAAALEYAREPETLPKDILTPGEARRIIEAADPSTVLGYRDRMILETLYATGIRKTELLNLTVADVNFEEEVLRINGGKGARDRVVPLTRVAAAGLETYIKAVRPQLLGERKSESLFPSPRRGGLSDTTLGYLVEKYARKANVKKHVTPHLWRHSCATHLLQNRANLRHVQEILGHRSLATTERYLHLTITELKEAHRRFHPREKDVAR
ncbi:MAG: tyrosine-type recombinase/integrase [Opitutaceae bacterium]